MRKLRRPSHLWIVLCCLSLAACPTKMPTAPSEPASESSARPSRQSPAAAQVPVERSQTASAEEPLEWEELLTGGARGDEALPMVIAIHGLGDRPDRFGKLFLQYQGKARIVLPRGPHRAGGGRSWFETDIRNGIVVKVDEEEFEESLRRLASLAKRVSEEKPTVGKPVVTGFSQGGILSFALAAESPESIRGAIPVAGMLPRKLWPVKAAGKDGMTCRLQALHGRDDSLVPYDEAKSSVEHLAKMGWEAQLETFPDTGHTISFEMRQRLYELLETWQ